MGYCSIAREPSMNKHALDKLKSDPNVAAKKRNSICGYPSTGSEWTRSIPSLWGLNKPVAKRADDADIDCTRSLGHSDGNSSVVVGVIDTASITHIGSGGQYVRNTGETPVIALTTTAMAMSMTSTATISSITTATER